MPKTPWSAEANASPKKAAKEAKEPASRKPAPKAPKKGGAAIDPELQVMLGDIELIDGRPQLSEANFDQWERRLSATPRTEDRLEKAAQLLALAKYFEEEGGPAANRCIAQLLTFATFLRGEPVGPDEPRAKPERSTRKGQKAGDVEKPTTGRAPPKPRPSVPRPRPSARGGAKRAARR